MFKKGLLLTCVAVFLITNVAGKEKIRILVDKVFSRNANKTLSENDFKAIKNAGFNVISPRWHSGDLKILKTYAQWAKKINIEVIPWMRGTLSLKSGDSRLVLQNGHQAQIASPLSDELWSYLNQRIAQYAEMSKTLPIFGAFLDFEMYDRPKYCHAYPLSYDVYSLHLFAKKHKLQIPTLAFAKRYPYLMKNNLLDRYTKFQNEEFKRRCLALRRKIDQINPEFRFVIYQGEYLVSNILFAAVSTEKAPVVIALSNTYGPACTLLPEGENIEINRQKVLQSIALIRKNGNYPFDVLGGMDPVEPGNTPEFCAKNAVAVSELCSGYWVFYEGMKPSSKRHAEYMEWFKIANQDIVKNRYKLDEEPWIQPAKQVISTIIGKTDLPQLALYGGKKYFFSMLNNSGFGGVHKLQSFDPHYLKQFNIVILQNLNIIMPANSKLHKILRSYVAEGGNLILAHDTGWFLEGLFPEIAVKGYPAHNVSNIRHVLDTAMVALKAPAIRPNHTTETTYTSGFSDHMIFLKGPKGTVLAKNRFGDPVIIAGRYGKGKVVFCGSYLAYKHELSGHEKTLFFDILKWMN